MKQLLILSGKGGTGKTTVAGAFIKLSKVKAYADCDVDAPNLHLSLKQFKKTTLSDFYGMPKAKINPAMCVACDFCRQSCRFNAIRDGKFYFVDSLSCEGCGVCEAVCPAGAICMEPAAAGELKLCQNGDVFAISLLKIGSGNSGKLVSEVKKQMTQTSSVTDLAIIDGPPGIGCPAIASISGVDLILIVAEPSISGISDMERVLKIAEIFRTPAAVCVNKYDINITNTQIIENFCSDNNIPFTGKIPFDTKAVQAINVGQTIVDIDCNSGRAVKNVFAETMKLVLQESEENKA